MTREPARLLDLTRTAEILGISVRTLRRVIDRGELPVYRIGRAVRIHPDDLVRFIEKARSS